jgi:hypothetical protein
LPTIQRFRGSCPTPQPGRRWCCLRLEERPDFVAASPDPVVLFSCPRTTHSTSKTAHPGSRATRSVSRAVRLALTRSGFGAADETTTAAEHGAAPQAVQATGRQRQRAYPAPRSSQQRPPLLSSCSLTIWLRDRRRKNVRQDRLRAGRVGGPHRYANLQPSAHAPLVPTVDPAVPGRVLNNRGVYRAIPAAFAVSGSVERRRLAAEGNIPQNP